MAAIYGADNWCDDCAEAIRDDLRAHGKAPIDPGDEHSYDSDEFPKRAGDDEESDSPQHCAAGSKCLNARRLSDGTKIGLLFGELTSEGIEYVKAAIAEGGLVAEFWKAEYEEKGYSF
ncbi:hypothetical protein LCGC14_1377920 [marine sediment metagenome]|uniref:Uncharacterized protein n=1 Tax=marine sediment metagenome TaxID=412755 RepID=A0A0F9K3W2_9ZZZZ